MNEEDQNVGTVRTLTMEPNITSTYGYIDTSKDVNDMNSTQLFSAVELITPMGAGHNDPDRTAICLNLLL